MTRARGLLWAVAWALPVVAADQVIKGLVLRAFPAGGSHLLVPGVLELSVSRNHAAAFGLFSTLRHGYLIALVIAVLGIFVVLAWPYLTNRVGVVMAALVLGGALGNLVDRIVRTYVVDYLQLLFQFTIRGRAWMWPVFNLADICVVSGVGLLIILLFRSERRSAPAPADTPVTEPADPSGGNA